MSHHDLEFREKQKTKKKKKRKKNRFVSLRSFVCMVGKDGLFAWPYRRKHRRGPNMFVAMITFLLATRYMNSGNEGRNEGGLYGIQ